MTAYDVDLAEVRLAVAELATCQRDLLALAVDIDHAQDRLQAGWLGQASDAQASSYPTKVTTRTFRGAGVALPLEKQAGKVRAAVLRWLG